jgi:hypothetical protein
VRAWYRAKSAPAKAMIAKTMAKRRLSVSLRTGSRL